MLPTTGYFKDIDCPYHEDACGRPYCHFRHRKKSQEFSEDSQDGVEQPSQGAVPTYNPTPKSQLQNVRSHIPISYVPDIVVRTERSLRNPPTVSFANVTYKPTPLSELSKNSQKGTVDDECQFSDNDDNLNFDIDLSTECALIDDIINEKAEEVDEDTEGKGKVEEKISDKVKKSITDKGKDKKKPDEMKSKPKKSKSESSKDKSRSDDKKSGKEHRSGSSKSDNKSKSKSSESKHREHSNRSHKHKDSDKSHRKDKHKDRHKDKHKSKDRERSNEYNRKEKSKESRKSKEKSKEKKFSDNENDEKPNQPPKQTIPDEEDPSNDFDEIADDDDLNNPTLEEECYRIFNEYKPEPINPPDPTNEIQTVQEYVPTPKKRIAHQGADNTTVRIPHEPPKQSQNPALMMLNRFKVARQAQSNNEQQNLMSEVKNIKRSGTDDVNKNAKILKMSKETLPVPVKEPSMMKPVSLIDQIINGSSTSGSKSSEAVLFKPKVKKIAPVHNVNSIQQAKAKIAEIANRSNASKTPMQTISKGTKRVAHIPDMSMGDIPDVLEADNKKIPLNIRTRYLTLLADECLKLYLLKSDAYDRALKEELKVTKRCSAIVTYRNSAMLSVNRIRKELQEREGKGLGPISPDDVDPNEETSPFKGKQFHQNVSGYLLTEQELNIHGYPREGPVPGKAIIKSQKSVPKVNLNPNQRLCCRCFKVYIIDDRGYPAYEEECQYHSLKKRTIRGEQIYLCCKSSDESGCVTAPTHVCESDTELEGYQTTLAASSESDPRSHAVYALDCEMCYTTRGLELTRVTIVDADCKTVYESLVKPLHPIIDYNTQFSGITKEQMDRTSTSILQVQANILHLCNANTILIGHSLESDMKALKIVHSAIIDTSVLFPHRLGLPYKKALRVLASEFLRKIIQNDVNGHDSAEDAITCMELVIWKLKEDLKLRNVKT